MDAPEGAVVLDDRYELRTKLRRAKDCRVYRARDLAEERDVALTVLPSSDAAAAQRFERDRALLEEADSPVLVPLLAISGPEAPVPYVVSELIEAESLRTRLSRTALHPELVRRIGLDVAAGLAALHRVGAAHGGVNVTNVLVPRIVSSGRLAARLKGYGEVAGPGGDEAPTAAGDVRALGLVLLACLSGRGAGQERPRSAAAASPADLPPGTPAALVELLSAMTDPEPERRPTAEDASRALQELKPLIARRPTAPSMPLGPATTSAPAARPPRRSRSGRARHRLPWYAAVGTGGVAAAGIVLLTISASVLQPQGSIQALPRSSSGALTTDSPVDGIAGGPGSAGATTAADRGTRPNAAGTSAHDAVAQLLGRTASTSSAQTGGDSLVLARSTTRTTTGGTTPIAELTSALATGAADPRTTAPTPLATSTSPAPAFPSGSTTGGTSSPSGSPSSPASPGGSSSPTSPSSSPSSPSTSPLPSPTTTSSPSSSPSPEPSTQAPSPQPTSSAPTTEPSPTSTATSDPSPSTSTPSIDPSPSSSATSSDPAPSATTGPGPTVSASTAAGGVAVSAP